MSNVATLPVWKKGASVAERFYELGRLAEDHPERFSKVIVIYLEDLPAGRTQTREISAGCTTTDALGLLELDKQQVLADAQL